MEKEKEVLYQYLREIRELIDKNEKEDGTYAFDAKRVEVALDFVKRDIESSSCETDKKRRDR